MKMGSLVCTFIIAVFVVSAAYGQENSSNLQQPTVDLQQLEALKKIQARNEDGIMNIPGVMGIGIGLTQDNKGLAFIVYVEKLTPSVKARVPDNIERVPVRLIESGVFKAY